MSGLLRGVARTAVIAGTASSVNGRVQRRQAERFAERDAQIMAQRTAAYQEQVAAAQAAAVAQSPVAPAPVAAAPQGEVTDLVTQLKSLAELRDQGILTEAEFEAQKAKLLA